MIVHMPAALPFVHPAFAYAGLAAGVIPILVHLINRRRHKRVKWAAMAFLLAASRRSSRRTRLEHWLLMLVRIAAIALLGFAVARPYLPTTPLMIVGTQRAHRILVIDTSLSMSARQEDGTTRFDAAMATARALLASFPGGDAVSIVTLAEPAGAPVDHAAYDRRLVREQLAAIKATQRVTDTVGGLTKALEIARATVAESRVAAGNVAVYVISDLPRATWFSEPGRAVTPAADIARTLADASRLTIVRTASADVDNAAVTGVAADSTLVGVGHPVRITAEVTNFGSRVLRGATLTLQSEGRVIRRSDLAPIASGKSTTVSASTVFSSAGTHIVEASLSMDSPDALDTDNVRRVSLSVRESIPMLLVDGRPGRTALAGEAGYLATALAPKLGPADRTLIEPVVISALELDGEALLRFDVIVLCNVARLAEPVWRRLEAFVAEGGGLAVFCGDLVNIDNYNRFGFAGGAGVLPGSVGRAPVREAGGSYTHVAVTTADHPITRGFADLPKSGLFLARVDNYLPLTVESPSARVILRYNNEDPALVVSRFGRGHTVFCTTTADMDWTNLPAKGDYVSLVRQIVSFLSPSRMNRRNLTVGESIRARLTPAQSSMPIKFSTDDGTSVAGRLVPDGDGLAVVSDPLSKSGVVTLSIGPSTTQSAVNVAARDSDLRTVDAREMEGWIDRRFTFVSHPGAVVDQERQTPHHELSRLALCAVLVLLVCESWIAMRFGSQRAAAVSKYGGTSDSPRAGAETRVSQ